MVIHSARLEDEDWQWVRIDSGIRLPVTTVARTIVDLLLSGEEFNYLERAVREAFDNPLSAREALRAAIARRRKAGAKQRVWAELTIDDLASGWGSQR